MPRSAAYDRPRAARRVSSATGRGGSPRPRAPPWIRTDCRRAMSHAGTPADRVDAGRADAVLAEQARGHGQDLLPILRRSLLGDPYPPSSLVPIPLTWW